MTLQVLLTTKDKLLADFGKAKTECVHEIKFQNVCNISIIEKVSVINPVMYLSNTYHVINVVVDLKQTFLFR